MIRFDYIIFFTRCFSSNIGGDISSWKLELFLELIEHIILIIMCGLDGAEAGFMHE